MKRKLKHILFLKLLTKFQFDAQRESYDDFPKVTYLGCNSGVCRNPNYLELYHQKYSEPRSEIWARDSPKLSLTWVLISNFETLYKKQL